MRKPIVRPKIKSVYVEGGSVTITLEGGAKVVVSEYGVDLRVVLEKGHDTSLTTTLNFNGITAYYP